MPRRRCQLENVPGGLGAGTGDLPLAWKNRWPFMQFLLWGWSENILVWGSGRAVA